MRFDLTARLLDPVLDPRDWTLSLQHSAIARRYGRETVTQVKSAVIRHIRGLTRDQAVIDDLIQEINLAMLQTRPTLITLDRYRQWACRVATNKSYDLARRSFTRREQGLPELDPAKVDPVEANLESAELSDQMQEALEHVAPRHRAALILRFYCQLSYKDIAAYFDCSPEAARLRIHRALNALRAVLERA